MNFQSFIKIVLINNEGNINMLDEKPRILIAESRDLSYANLESMLAGLNINKVRAFSGNDAVKKLLEHKFAAVILTEELQDMKGIECIKIIRSNKKIRHLTALFLTASNFGHEEIFQSNGTGLLDCLHEQIKEPDILINKIKIYIELYLQKNKLDEQAALLEEQTIELDKREKMFENELIERMKVEEEITNQTMMIMDSINYASIIQKNLLPHPDILKNYLADIFVIWQPRDVIGGDFYWFTPLADGFLIAIIDCTGHGVPGAFMTIAVNQMLKRIIDEGKTSSPACILNAVDRNIKESFYDEKVFNKIHVGLDMGICRIDTVNSILTFSGAKIPLYLMRGEKMEEIMCSKRSAGYGLSFDSGRKNEYHEIEIPYSSGDMFYMFSDGIIDQNGDCSQDVFGIDKLLMHLSANRALPMEECKETLLAALNDFMASEEQRDDITVIGFKLK
jgi:phosphoserine phosphatase RsbU/P